MTKEDLVNYFSYYLKEGRDKIELRNEAIDKGYTNKEINEAFSIIGNQGADVSTKKSDKGKIIILSILIFIVILMIIIIIFLNLTEIGIEEKNEVEEIELPSQILRENFDLSRYWEENPDKKENAITLSESYRDCKDIEVKFSYDESLEEDVYMKEDNKNISERNKAKLGKSILNLSGINDKIEGSYFIKDLKKEGCLISYRGELTLDCYYDKEGVELIYLNQSQMIENNIEYWGHEMIGSSLFAQDHIIVTTISLFGIFSYMISDYNGSEYNNSKFDEELDKAFNLNYTIKTLGKDGLIEIKEIRRNCELY